MLFSVDTFKHEGNIPVEKHSTTIVILDCNVHLTAAMFFWEARWPNG